MSKKKPQEVKREKINSNKKIEEIVKDFPKSICAYPRGAFEDQLKKHLLKHKIK